MFEVTFKNPKNQVKIPRVVNIDLLTCSCLRKVYYGFCCSHIFCVLLEKQRNINEKLTTLINNRWRAKSDNNAKNINLRVSSRS
ncbi:MAG: hypothetical protein EOO46_20810 [Flavobacterium sp.]|nr:MAG: hypothetical protein EOO46_20810 [Flavobacterium sp.]